MVQFPDSYTEIGKGGNALIFFIDKWNAMTNQRLFPEEYFCEILPRYLPKIHVDLEGKKQNRSRSKSNTTTSSDISNL